jgi:hypothetical protein
LRRVSGEDADELSSTNISRWVKGCLARTKAVIIGHYPARNDDSDAKNA